MLGSELVVVLCLAVLMGTLLVIVTAWAVAAAAHGGPPGQPAAPPSNQPGTHRQRSGRVPRRRLPGRRPGHPAGQRVRGTLSGLPPDQEVRAEELRTAETSALTDALSALPGVAARLGTDPQVIEELQAEYRQRLSILNALHSEDAPADHTAGLERARQYRELGLALVAKKRNTVIRLRDERRIDDSVLLRLQARLDIEELRLAAPHDAAEEEDED